jgi:hypothetical protein
MNRLTDERGYRSRMSVCTNPPMRAYCGIGDHGLNAVFPFMDRKVFIALHACNWYLLQACHLLTNWFRFRNMWIRKKTAGKK